MISYIQRPALLSAHLYTRQTTCISAHMLPSLSASTWFSSNLRCACGTYLGVGVMHQGCIQYGVCMSLLHWPQECNLIMLITTCPYVVWELEADAKCSLPGLMMAYIPLISTVMNSKQPSKRLRHAAFISTITIIHWFQLNWDSRSELTFCSLLK